MSVPLVNTAIHGADRGRAYNLECIARVLTDLAGSASVRGPQNYFRGLLGECVPAMIVRSRNTLRIGMSAAGIVAMFDLMLRVIGAIGLANSSFNVYAHRAVLLEG